MMSNTFYFDELTVLVNNHHGFCNGTNCEVCFAKNVIQKRISEDKNGLNLEKILIPRNSPGIPVYTGEEYKIRTLDHIPYVLVVKAYEELMRSRQNLNQLYQNHCELKKTVDSASVTKLFDLFTYPIAFFVVNIEQQKEQERLWAYQQQQQQYYQQQQQLQYQQQQQFQQHTRQVFEAGLVNEVTSIKGELDAMRDAIHYLANMNEKTTHDFEQLKQDVKDEIGDLSADMKNNLDSIKDDMKHDMSSMMDSITQQFRNLMSVVSAPPSGKSKPTKGAKSHAPPPHVHSPYGHGAPPHASHAPSASHAPHTPHVHSPSVSFAPHVSHAPPPHSHTP